MKNEEIYKLVERQEESLKEVMELKLSGFKAEIQSTLDLNGYKLDTLIEYQEEQNGKIRALEDETKVWRLIHRNPKAAGIVIGLAIIGCVAVFVFKNFII